MRNQEAYLPTQRTAERAAELWKRMLRSPKYDNGDASPAGGLAMMMAHAIPSNVDEEKLTVFGQELAKCLMTRDAHGWCDTHLGVDYGPCKTLADCAKAAGLLVEFPWKTTMHVYADHLSLAYGYGAEHLNHYALSDGRWLITNLYGRDIEKIKSFVMDGTLPEFVVES